MLQGYLQCNNYTIIITGIVFMWYFRRMLKEIYKWIYLIVTAAVTEFPQQMTFRGKWVGKNIIRKGQKLKGMTVKHFKLLTF